MTDSDTWSPDGHRFNPPPGWPVPAKGWVPPPNWQPDPAWPPPPPGWVLWIPVGYPTEPAIAPASPAPAPPASLRPRMILASKILAGVITFAATIAGTYLAFADRPEPYTMDDWSRRANAVCEQNFGSLQTPIYALTPMLAQVTAAGPAAGSLPQLTTTVLGISGAFRKLNGDIRLIDLPEGADTASVNQLLDSGTEVSAALSGVATFLTNYQQGKATPADGGATIQGLQQVMTVSLPAWSAEVNQLGLNQCLSIVGTPTAPSPSGPAGSSDAARTALIATVNPSVAKDCQPNPGAETAGVTAAVNCTAVATGLSHLPLLLQFTGAAAMNAWVDSLNAPTTSTACVDGRGRGTWYHDNVRMGALICQPLTDGTFRIVWAFEGRNVVAVAQGATPAAANTWWEQNANLLTAP